MSRMLSWSVFALALCVCPAKGLAAPARSEARIVEVPVAADRGLARTVVERELAFFDFEGVVTGPDAQGWVARDLTRNDDSYWRVEDFAGFGPAYAPLSGTKSMWCGLRSDDPRGGLYTALPGYGSRWRQSYVGGPFAGDPALTIVFDARWDLEEFADVFLLEYRVGQGDWVQVAQWTGVGSLDDHTVLIPTSGGTQVTIRFVVLTGATFDDADGLYDSNGALVLDDLRVLHGASPIHTEDFEGEVVGDGSTSDGRWSPVAVEGYGLYAGQVRGSNVRQDDPATVNSSWFWGFFIGSSEDYRCVDPGQAATPTARPTNLPGARVLFNEIRSPWVSIDPDPSDPVVPDLDGLRIEFDIYRDLPLLDWLFFQVAYRFRTAGIETDWFNDETLYYRSDASWQTVALRFPLDIGAVKQGATHLLVTVYAVMVPDWRH